MKVSVVIPAKNEGQSIQDCIRSLLILVEPPNEIIVVDNNSEDHTYEKVKQMQQECRDHDVQLVLLSCVYGNQIEARQLGFKTAKHQLIASIDADSHLSSDWFVQVKNFFEVNEEVVAIGGPLEYDTLIYNIVHRLVYLYLAISKKRFYFYGSNACFRKDAFKQTVGLSGCRELVKKMGLLEPYDDLYLSYQLKKVGIIRPCFSIKAKVSSRVNGKRATRIQLIKRLVRQLRDSLKLQEIL